MSVEDQGENAQSDIQEAYKRRYLELQRQQQAEAQARALLKNMLEPAAYERIMNIRISSPELYSQLTSMVAYLAQRGQLGNGKRLTEAQLKELAGKVVEKTRRESRITRLSK